MLTLVLALQGLVIGNANAQTFDAHGPNLPPDGASVGDPVFGAAGGHTGAPVFTVLTQAANGLLVDRISDGTEITDIPVVDSAFGLELGAAAGLTGPVGLGVSAPVWFLSQGETQGGAAFGDTSVWVPIRLLSTKARLGLIPFVTVPTGANQRYLGEPGFSGGGLVSGGYTFGPMLANLDLGIDATGRTDVPEWPGGAYGRYALDVGLVPNDTFGIHAELRSRIPLNSTAPTLPTEAMGTLKARPAERLWITTGLGTALTRGVGAPALRFLVGISTAPGKKPVDAEIITGPIPKEIHIVDERMVPLTGATIKVGGFEVQTDFEGYADIPARVVTRSPVVVVEHLGFDTLTMDVNPEDEWWEFKMQRVPVPLQVSVVGPEGALNLVDVYVDGPYKPEPPVIDEAGVFNWALRPGVWRVRMSSPGLGDQERTIVIEQDRADAIRVDAVLAALVNEDTAVRVSVVDRLGRPVEDAVVALGDRDLGTTGTGGDLVVYGLDEGDTELIVRSERFGADEKLNLVVDSSGNQEIEAVLDWQPGSVQLVAEDANGFPVDATVAFSGPANLPERQVGTDGDEVFVLRPGTWDVRVRAPKLGTQTRRIEVTDAPGELITVRLSLLPEEEGNAEIELRVVDVDGGPLPGITVFMDKKRAGWTGSDGTLSLMGLHPGFRTFEYKADQLVPVQDELTLVPGRQLNTTSMAWVNGVTDLLITGPDGNPLDALVTFIGPGKLKPAQVGLDGAERVILDVGEWKLIVTADGMTDQSRTLVIPEGSKRLNEMKLQMAERPPELIAMEEAAAAAETDGVAQGDDATDAGSPQETSDSTETGTTTAASDGAAPPTDQTGTPDETGTTTNGDTTNPDGSAAGDGAGTTTTVATADGPDSGPDVVEAPVYTLDPNVGQLSVTVVDTEGEVIENAEVTLDGQALGHAIDGTLRAEGVAKGESNVMVLAEGMDATVVEVDVGDGETEVQVEMSWAPGALEVQVEDAAGEAVEATVTLKGPEETIAPRTTVDGAAVVGATPGQWFVVVESDGMETQEIPIDLTEEAQLTELDVVMAPVPEDEARVVIVAETPEGETLANAEVKVDGEVIGRTSGAGTIEILNFDESDVTVTITPEAGYDEMTIELERPKKRDKGEEQRHTVVAEHASQSVAVQVVDGDGNAVPAEIIAVGSTTLGDPVKIDDQGNAALDLKPGTYTVTARTEDGSLATAEVVVRPPAVPSSAGSWSVESTGSDAGEPGTPGSPLPDANIEVVGSSVGASIETTESGAAVVQMVVEQVQAVVVDDKLTPVEPLLFDVGRNNVREDIRPMVADLARWLLVHQEAALVEVAGHTDDVGGVAMNQALSERRARTVESLLVEFGVAPERLMSRGYGLSRPVTAKTDDISRARNRRVELVVLEWAGGE